MVIDVIKVIEVVEALISPLERGKGVLMKRPVTPTQFV